MSDYKYDDTNLCGKNLWFDTEKDKKSAFFLNLSDKSSMLDIDKPCHMLVQCCQYTDGFCDSRSAPAEPIQSWLFGGMEIHSNARNIEVYATLEGATSKEEYWQTCSGMLLDIDDNNSQPTEKKWHKTIILPPSSKPTSIKSLHLKLLSLRPAKCTVGSVRTVKMKGRIFDTYSLGSNTELIASKETKDNEGITQGDKITSTLLNPGVEKYQGGISMNPSTNNEGPTPDIGKAISALSMLVRNVQSDMQQSMSSSIGEIQKIGYVQNRNLAQKVNEIEKNLGEVQINLGILLNEVKISRELTQAQEKERKMREKLMKKEAERELAKNQQQQDALLERIMEDQRKFLMQEAMKFQEEILGGMVEKIFKERGGNEGNVTCSHHKNDSCLVETTCDKTKSSHHIETIENTLFIDTNKTTLEEQNNVQKDFKLPSDGEKIDLNKDSIQSDFGGDAEHRPSFNENGGNLIVISEECETIARNTCQNEEEIAAFESSSI